ncbi:MAG TPA: winged helix DNA-binding domain-containing protein [Candidatus Limnocylindria bacterium]|nr:winged helix DNA-binding domain-containing protein [Candidatus Limnocylindria bacterium]
MRRLAWSDVLARRLARHHLLRPAPRAKLAEVVAAVCGIHAQVMPSAELSLGLRVKGLTKKQLDVALWEKRELVKTYGIRGTVHLVPTRELGWWLAALRACEPDEPDPRRLAYFGVTAKQVADAADAIEETLVGRRLTRDQLGEEVRRRVGRWVERTVNAFGGAWPVWQIAIGVAALRGGLCFGPPQGARVTFVRPADWIGKLAAPSEATAQRDLFRRYLAAFGPASEAEFAQWATISPARAREIARSLGAGIETVNVEGTQRWQIAGDRAGRLSASTLLLPRFDSYIVGSHPRDVLAPPAVVARAAATGLLTRRVGSGRAFLVGPLPVLVIDGTVAGIWESTRTAKRIAVRVQPLVKIEAKHRAALRAEATRIGAIVGLEPSLEIGKVRTRPHL